VPLTPTESVILQVVDFQFAALAYRLPMPEGTVGLVAGNFWYMLTGAALVVALFYSLRNNK
jgi:hypothetical protein